MTAEPLCTLDNKPLSWHEEHQVKHEFSPPGSGFGLKRKDGRPVVPKDGTTYPGAPLKAGEQAHLNDGKQSQELRRPDFQPGQIMPGGPQSTLPSLHLPRDLALRLLLVEKGVIDPSDLADMDNKLSLVMGSPGSSLTVAIPGPPLPTSEIDAPGPITGTPDPSLSDVDPLLRNVSHEQPGS